MVFRGCGAAPSGSVGHHQSRVLAISYRDVSAYDLHVFNNCIVNYFRVRCNGGTSNAGVAKTAFISADNLNENKGQQMVKQFLLAATNRILRYIIRMIPGKYELPINYYKYRVIGMFDEEILMLPKLIAKGGVAIDIGANIGLYSYVLSRICDAVESFEPVPSNRRVLQAYNARNINVHEVALSSKSGTAVLNIPIENDIEIYGHASLTNQFANQKRLQVTTKKLDDYNFINVRFIKIDVEGHELDVIRGAKRTIEICRPIMLIEIEQRQLSFPINIVFEEVLACGYKGFFLYQNKLHSLTDFSIELYQIPFVKGEHKDKRKYVNNFIFVPDKGDAQT
jgi:FkbM family methyltransferase